MKVGFRIAEGGAAQGQESIHVPGLEHILIGVKVNREIEKIGYEWDRLAVFRQPAGLQHVQSFNDKDVRPVDLDRLVRHYVVDQMRIDRRPCWTPAGFHIGKEPEQRRQVIALWKALL